MESSWPAVDVSNDRRRAVEVLIRGREFTKQLDAIIQQASVDGNNYTSSKFAGQYLVVKVLESLNETLSILMTSTDSNDVPQQPFRRKTVPQEPFGKWDIRKSSVSSVSCKTSAIKDRKGCFKRRRTSETWKRETSILIDDGHSWRKYGQKVILNVKHPRNYFRCTHKVDQGCQATKQVQKIQDDPPRYLTTYYGHHTCKDLLVAPQIILASTEEESSILLSFESNNPRNKNYSDYFQSLCRNKLTPSDYFMSHDLTTCETFEPMTALLSASDQGDVISSRSYSCKDIFLDDPGDFLDDAFQFGFL